jgi:hypothetical protein
VRGFLVNQSFVKLLVCSRHHEDKPLGRKFLLCLDWAACITESDEAALLDIFEGVEWEDAVG